MNTHTKFNPAPTRGTRVISLEEALAQNATPSFLLTVANSLDRLGKSHAAEADAMESDTFDKREIRRYLREQSIENFANAGILRRLARDVRIALKIRAEKAALER